MTGIIGGPDGPAVVYIGSPVIQEPISLGLFISLLAAVSLLAYFLGNISPSTIMAKRQGIDIKKEGSGNAGTNNALRVMGKKAGVITLLVDIAKGAVAVLIGMAVIGFPGEICAALMVFLGHVWPVIYRFRGGKGVATAFGAALAVNPLMALIALAAVAAVVLISRRMSVGSIAGAILFPVLAVFMEPGFTPVAIVMACILVFKHRANIGRLIRGEEPVMSIFVKDDDNGGKE